MEDDRRVHPHCINASNPYHECVEYCFRKIAEAKARMIEKETGSSSLLVLFVSSEVAISVSSFAIMIFYILLCLYPWLLYFVS